MTRIWQRKKLARKPQTFINGFEPLEARRVLAAQPVISEFVADNDRSMLDGDGDASDWIEVLNAGDESIDLEGWYLTDNAVDLNKWKFPSTTLDPGESTIVFASDKDRDDAGFELHTNFRLSATGEYLALVEPDGETVAFDFAPSYPAQVEDVSYGLPTFGSNLEMVSDGSSGRLWIPTDDSVDPFSNDTPSGSWLDPNFNDAGWQRVNVGVGFETSANGGSIADNIRDGGNIQDAMSGVGSSAYLRIPFLVPDPTVVDSLKLQMHYDDGFVAYINGLPVAADNVGELGDVNFASVASSSRSASQTNEASIYDLSDDAELLNAGLNVLMIHGVNVNANDSDFLIRPRLFAQSISVNVSAPRYFTSPTPGEINGAGTTNVGPLFVRADYQAKSNSPAATPRASEPIIVTANVASTFEAVGEVTLRYRVMYGSTRNVTMVDDGTGDDAFAGDGVFTATIPGNIADAGEMVRWYITADDLGGRDSRFPAFESQTDSAEYFGTVIHDTSIASSNLPVFHWFARNPSSANTTRGTRSSMFFDGEFYDNILFDIHGQSTRGGGFPKKSYDVDFNRDHRFRWNDDTRRMKDINLLTNYADKGKFRNSLAYEVWRDGGGGYGHLAEPVRVQQNGEFFAVYDFVEDGDDRFLERIGLDPEGAFYKAYNRLNSASGNQKITRRNEGFSDLQALIDGADRNASGRKEYFFDNVNLPATINYLASMVVNAGSDCCHKNHYVYRDTNGTGEWMFLPWDADLSFGRKWTSSQGYFDDVIKIDTPVPFGTNNNVIDSLLSVPEIREMYFRRVRTLMDEYLQPPGTPTEELHFERRLDEFLELVDPTNDNPRNGSDDADLDFQKWGTWGNNFNIRQDIQSVKDVFLPERRAFLYNQNTTGNGGEIPGDISFSFTTLIPENHPVSALVPTSNQLGTTWRQVGYNDAGWLQGNGGIGYERGNGYDALIDLDLLSNSIPANRRIDTDGDGRNENNSVYVRQEFALDSIPTADSLTMQVRFDDGFVAYLNGTEVARRNFTGTASWDSQADSSGDEATSSFVPVDITRHMDKLQVGNNVLAIHAMNRGSTSSDMLIHAKLAVGVATETPNAGVALKIGEIDFNPQSGNQDQEFIEIQNETGRAVDISGWQLSGAVEHEFVPGTIIPTDRSLFVTPDVVAFRSRAAGPSGGQSLFVQGGYEGHLSNFGETIQILAPGGEIEDTKTYAGDPSDAQNFLRVSEIMFNPIGASAAELEAVPNADNDQFEFIELVNTSESITISLDGVQFTGGVDFDFTRGLINQLGPGERVVIVKDQSAFTARYDLGSQLRVAGEYGVLDQLQNDGETLKLEDANNSTIQEFRYDDESDAEWPARADGHGSSLELDESSLSAATDFANGTSWVASNAIHGTPGFARTAHGDSIVINEVLSHTDLPQVDSVELHNPSNATVELSGYFLSDSSASVDAFAKFTLPAATIAANGYLVVDESDFNPGQGTRPNDFAFDGAHGDEVYLTFGDGTPQYFADFVSFGAAANGESFGRVGEGAEDLAPQLNATLGSSNSDPRVGPLTITEVHYNPSAPSADALLIDPELKRRDLEFVELYNRSNQAIDLTNWRMRKGIDYDFADGSSIPAGEALLVISFNPAKPENAARLNAFRWEYGLSEDVAIVGGYSGQLNDSGDRLQLQRPDSPPADEPNFIPRLLEDEVLFGDESPWPVAADGLGQSLNRSDVRGYGNAATSWTAAAPTPGEFDFDPGELLGDFNSDGLLDDADLDLLAAAIIGNDPAFDLTNDEKTDRSDHSRLVQLVGIPIGDSNLDGVFDSTDLIVIFQANEYEDAIARNSTWSEGDWNGDQEFDSGDLVAAFTAGEYIRE